MSWSPIPEMLWKIDRELVEARKLPGWPAFHRGCGRNLLFFDHIEKKGREYTCVAFSLRPEKGNREYIVRATGRGKTVLAALKDAHEQSGMATEETRKLFDQMNGCSDDFDDLMVDDFDDL